MLRKERFFILKVQNQYLRAVLDGFQSLRVPKESSILNPRARQPAGAPARGPITPRAHQPAHPPTRGPTNPGAHQPAVVPRSIVQYRDRFCSTKIDPMVPESTL